MKNLLLSYMGSLCITSCALALNEDDGGDFLWIAVCCRMLLLSRWSVLLVFCLRLTGRVHDGGHRYTWLKAGPRMLSISVSQCRTSTCMDVSQQQVKAKLVFGKQNAFYEPCFCRVCVLTPAFFCFSSTDVEKSLYKILSNKVLVCFVIVISL